MIRDSQSNNPEQALRDKLVSLYGEETASETFPKILTLLHNVKIPASLLQLDERTSMVIAYADYVQAPNEKPLQTLKKTLLALNLPVSSLHVLPFYPYSSDDGFSVIDYLEIDTALGTWEDVITLAETFTLMFDAVINHISQHSKWFQAFLRSEAPYDNYFITLPADTDVSLVTRPRTHPLLTSFETAQGRKYVWTTFSDDQIDLNVANPSVLVELVHVLLMYVEKGASFIRLDAIAFLWKQVGTTSIHLPQTHTIIQLFRDVLDCVAPHVILITETNVPHIENLSYFGNGTNEAQMVYNFALPPLIFHTLLQGSANALTQWAQTIQPISDQTTFFNFTASHDGIGVRPVQDILTADQIQLLADTVLAHGGQVSYKGNSDGTQSPYELNITYFDAINAPELTITYPETALKRFIVSQAIMLAIVGVPGIYLPSLFGSRNDLIGVEHTGRSRSINREKFVASHLLAELQDSTSLKSHVLSAYRLLLNVRANHSAFHPFGGQIVHNLNESIFAVERISPNKTCVVLALHNVAELAVSVNLKRARNAVNLLDERPFDLSSDIVIAPYQILWLKLI